jgi:hypothetical protein
MPSARTTASQRAMYDPDGRMAPKGYVYMLVTRDPSVSGDYAYIKIGHSIDPIARVMQLKTGIALPIERLTLIGVADHSRMRPLEKWVHKGLSDLRTEGEWFRVKWNDKEAKDKFHQRVALLVRSRVRNPIVKEFPVHALTQAHTMMLNEKRAQKGVMRRSVS